MSSKIRNYLITGDTITLIIEGGNPLAIQSTHQYFAQVVNLCREAKYDEVFKLILGPDVSVEEYCNQEIISKDDKFYLKGVSEPLPETLGARLFQLMAQGMDYAPIKNFYLKVSKNPDSRVRSLLFKFIEDHKVPLLQDGNFLAYKRVSSNLCSFTPCLKNCQEPHEHIDNHCLHTLGKPVEMRRESVDSSAQDCSCGLHVANYNYAKGFYQSGSGLVLEMSVDPMDVCSIPGGYSGEKMRVCRYIPTAVNRYGPWEFAPDAKPSKNKVVLEAIRVVGELGKKLKSGKKMIIPTVNGAVLIQPNVLKAIGLSSCRVLVTVVNRRKCGSVAVVRNLKMAPPSSIMIESQAVVTRGYRVGKEFLDAAGLGGLKSVTLQWDGKILRIRG